MTTFCIAFYESYLSTMYLHYEKLVQQAEYVVVGKVDVEFGVTQHEHFLILIQ